MYKVIISVPMRGKSEEEIRQAVDQAKKDAISQTANHFYVSRSEVEVIDTVFDIDPPTHPLFYLGEAIKKMADADAVYFGKGWKNARGCRIEHECAVMYDKYVMYE